MNLSKIPKQQTTKFTLPHTIIIYLLHNQIKKKTYNSNHINEYLVTQDNQFFHSIYEKWVTSTIDKNKKTVAHIMLVSSCKIATTVFIMKRKLKKNIIIKETPFLFTIHDILFHLFYCVLLFDVYFHYIFENHICSLYRNRYVWLCKKMFRMRFWIFIWKIEFSRKIRMLRNNDENEMLVALDFYIKTRKVVITFNLLSFIS